MPRPALESQSHENRRDRLLILSGLLVVGALVRIILIAQARGTPLWDLLFLDALSYHKWAERLAGGDWVGTEAFHMPPLYPYLLGIVYRFAGAGDAIKYLQAALGVLNGALIFVLAERVAGRTAAIIAFVLSLFYGPFLFYELQLLNTTLAITLALATVLALDAAVERGSARSAALGGLALGAGALVRPEFLLFAPLALAAILFVRRGAGAGGDASASRAAGGAAPARLALLFALGAAGPLALSGARNAIVSGDRVLITHHGGISFYMGNNESSDGTYRPPPFFQGTPEAIDQRDSKRFAEMDAGRALKMSEVEGYWYAKAFAFMREQPGRYVALVARKFALYWGNYEIPLNASWDFFKRYSPILLGAALSFGIVVPLACVGAWSLAGARRAIFPALFVLANMAAVVAFFVCDRYRLPAAPFLIVFAAAGVVRLAAFARARALRPLAISLAAVLALALLLNVRVAGNPSLSFARSHVAVGQSALRRGDRALAERAFRDAIRENRFYLDAYMNLGTLYQQENQIDRAIETYDQLLATNPDFAGAHLNRGACRQSKGDLDAALADYARAEALDPFLPAASNNVGFVQQALGRTTEAEAAFRRALAKDAGFVDARANLARLLESTGRPEAAAAEYAALVTALERGGAASAPALGAIESRFGDLLVANNRFVEAAPHFQRALAIGPPSADLLIKLGVTLSNTGRANEALQMLQRAVKEFPLDEEASWRVANVLLEWGDAGTAAIVFERAARSFAGNPRYSYGAAVAHTRANDLVRARAALDEAIRRGGEPIRVSAARDPRLAAIAARNAP